MRFEKVSTYPDAILPTRATAGSAGYDFYCVKDTIIPTIAKLQRGLYEVASNDSQERNIVDIIKSTGYKPTLIPTGIKAQIDPGYYLQLAIRSSTPLKRWIILANGIGVIDTDYYNNPDNEGHIMIQVINLSPMDQIVHKGEKIAQGIFLPYVITDDDNTSGTRTGGFGSTGG